MLQTQVSGVWVDLPPESNAAFESSVRTSSGQRNGVVLCEVDVGLFQSHSRNVCNSQRFLNKP